MAPHEHPSSARSAILSCSTCGRRFYLHESDSPPFCCERCKLIDLGRWLDESIQIPHEGGPDEGDHTEIDP